jgi:hypothetical protein
MNRTSIACFAVACCATAFAAVAAAQTASGIPHLQKQGTATQLIVDGKPFLALTGELGNNTATSMENMQSVWPRLVAGNLNCVLAAVSWAQVGQIRVRAGEWRPSGSPAQQPQARVAVVR